MDSEAGRVELPERGIAQFFFEVGFGSCWAEAFVRNDGTPPFPLTDALVERAWQIAGEAHDDPAEFDRYKSLADGAWNTRPTPDNGLREALEKCRNQFVFYASEHLAAGKVEKAQTNQRYADLCVEALSQAPR